MFLDIEWQFSGQCAPESLHLHVFTLPLSLTPLYGEFGSSMQK